MRTARVAEPDVPPAALARQRARRDRAYWSDLVFGRTIPALVAGVFLLDQGLLLAYALWGLLYLRRSFSILPEARRLVTTGPYGLSRNPLYLGEFTASLGVVLPNFGPWQALVLVAFIACQLLRIRWEEQVLTRTFPDDYKEYFKSVPRFIPQPWRRSR